MQVNLENKKVLLTGASGGIGKALSNKFINNGAKLIFTSSSKNKLDELKNLYGDTHSYYLLDLSKTENLMDNIKNIRENNKDIDIIINNAGIAKDNLLLRMSTEQWQEVIDTNLSSSFYIIKNILPDMVKNRKGIIIGITSVVALTGNPGQSNYTASKGGMIAMYKSLAIEVAQRNINVNLIAPGFIESPMTNKLNDNQKKTIMDKIPMKRFGLPEDIANMALFLTSDHSSYITGQTFHVNGGMLML
ncbi:3-oxoacyl-[acyl-carrier-protein] reductase [Alphaproteobacteria bacterium]|nr:3-oxoacyl-[acyl-carrier-protein] reductase [Alphaproteobacteria bacterium]